MTSNTAMALPGGPGFAGPHRAAEMWAGLPALAAAMPGASGRSSEPGGTRAGAALLRAAMVSRKAMPGPAMPRLGAGAGHAAYMGGESPLTATYSFNWQQQSPAASPSARNSFGLVYDAARNVVVLFGGSNGSSYLNDTWTWNGTSWTQLSPAHMPAARANMVMAYLPAQHETVLFGGQASGGLLNDTWVWNGTDWTQLTPATAPAARVYAAGTYDAAQGEVVLFGGLLAGGVAQDTWTFDGTNWTQQAPATAPSGRTQGTMVYDPETSSVVLFGGENSSNQALNDTWTWNGSAWTQQAPPVSPSAREAAAAGYDAESGLMLLFGGYSAGGGYRNDTWAWDGTTWTQLSTATEPAARGYTGAVESSPGNLVLFGGLLGAGGSGNDTWALTASSNAGNQQPVVNAMSPASGPAASPGQVTITGLNFSGATAVSFGSQAASSFTVVSNTEIVATPPVASSAGTVDVQVQGPGGTSATVTADQYTYTAAPTVMGISPASGATAGGNTVTLTGTSFLQGATVMFGSVAASGVTVVSSTQLTAVTPAGSAGPVTVTVTASEGSSTASGGSTYTYTQGTAPVVAGMMPAAGSIAGGTVVTIFGTNLQNTTGVWFGAVAATSFTVVSQTQITAVAPAGGAGAVDVTVTTPGGVSAASTGDQFFYAAPVYTVNNTTDPGTGTASHCSNGNSNTCSLRDAIAAANAAGSAVIQFAGSVFGTAQTISLVAPLSVSASGTVAIAGPGASLVTLSGGNAVTVLQQLAGTVRLSGVTLTGGSSATTGGAIAQAAGAMQLMLNSVTISNSTAAGGGGGVAHAAALVVDHSSFQGNSSAAGAGGAILQGGALTVSNSFFQANQAASGGALAMEAASAVAVTNSVFSSNSASNGSGAAIEQAYGSLSVSNSIFVGNNATAGGGAIAAGASSGSLKVTQSTFTQNQGVTAGAIASAAPFTATNSVFSGNGGAAQCSPDNCGGGSNVDDNGAATTWFSRLANYGGLLPAVLPLPGSSAIGLATSCAVSLDIRGYSRPSAGASTCDAGAVQTSYAATWSQEPPAKAYPNSSFPVALTFTEQGNALSLGASATLSLPVTLTGTGTLTGSPLTSISAAGVASGTLRIDTLGSSDRLTAFGLSSTSFDVTTPPTVTAISPMSGPMSGGTVVNVVGTGFTGATGVSFGTVAATGVTVNSDTSLTAVAPAQGAGTVDVTVTLPGGTSAANSADQYTYLTTPTVSVVNASSGSTNGGLSVLISGTSLLGATAVMFGSTPATSFTVVNSTTIAATTPVHGVAQVDVTVTTPYGTSAVNPGDQFTFALPPTITSVTPNSGPVSGGGTIVIAGSGFTSANLVFFEGTLSPHFTVVSDTEMTAVIPAATKSETVNVVVSTQYGDSAEGAQDLYSYIGVPIVTGVSPNAGPTAGGATVTITGAGFTAAATVKFNTAAATSVTYVNPTQLTAVAPAGAAGVVDVIVTTPGGTSSTSAADQYTYEAPPTVTGVSPSSGSSAGGTAVTITGTNLLAATAVMFGGVPATSFSVVSANTISAVSPGYAPGGLVDVTVTTAGGVSGTSSADQFLYTTAPQINFAVANQSFGVAPFAVNATSNSPGAISYSVVSGAATISGNTVTVTGTGSVTLEASQVASGSYTAGTANATFMVSAGTAPITFNVGPQTFGAAPFAVSASSASLGAFTYSVVSGPATVAGNTVTLTGAGNVVLKASQAADSNYVASSQTANFTVSAGTAAISFNVANQTFGAAPFAVSASSASLGTFTYSVVSGPATIAGNTVTLTGAGNVVLKASQAVDSNYVASSQTANFTVSAGAAAISFNVANQTFGAAPFAVSANSVSSGAFTYSVVSGNATIAGNVVTLTGAGNVVLKASQAADSNYVASSQTANFTVSAGTAPITFSVSPQTYGAAPFAVSANSVSSGAFTYSVVSGPATVAGNVVTLTGTGAVVLLASQAADASYVANSANASFNVAAEAPTVSFAGIATHLTTDAPFAVSATSNSSGAISYSVVSGPATVAGNTVTLSGTPGTVVLLASQAAKDPYAAGSAQTSFVVNTPTAPTITFNVPTHTYGDGPFAVSATSNSTGTLTYSVVSGPATISGSIVTLTGGGTVTLQASQVAAGTYSSGVQTVTFTVNPETVAISFAIPNQTYGTSSFPVSASSTSAGAFTYSIVSGPATMSGNVLTITGTGMVKVQAAQAATANDAAGSVVTSFTVSPGAPTIAFAAIPPHQATDTPFAVSATSNSSGAISYSVVSGPATMSGNTVTLNGSVGTVTLMASQAAADPYTAGSTQTSFAVNLASPAAISFNVANQTYGAAPFGVSANSASGGVMTYSVVSGPATIAGNVVTLTGTGTVVLKASQAAAGSYPANSQQTSFLVSAGTALITFNVGAQTFGAAPFAVSATSNSSGAISYSVVSGPATIAGNTVTLTGAGNVMLKASQAADANYSANSQTANFTVSAGTALITFNVGAQTFGAAPFAVSATSNSSGAISYSVVSGPATLVGNVVTLTGAGSVVLKASQAADANYAANSQQTSFLVSAGTAAITFNVANQTFGAAPFAVGASSASTGAMNYSVVSGPATIVGNTVTLTGAGNVMLKASQAADANYSANSQTANFTVSAGTAAITFNVGVQTFGAAPFAVSASSASTGAMTYSVVSGPATVAGNVVTLTGAGNVVLKASQAADANYSANSQTANFTVSAGTAPISFNVANQTFGAAPFAVSARSASTGAMTYSVVSGPATIAGNTVTLTGAGSVVLKASQAADANYAANSQTASLVASRATVALQWAQPPSIVYGTALGSAQLNAAASDNGAAVSGAFTYSPGAGTVLAAGSQPLQVSFVPADATDYATPAPVTVTLNVTQAMLTATANGATRVYGSANPSFSGTLSGAVNGDTFTESFNTSATVNSPAGAYAIVPSASGAGLSNYAVSAVNGTLTVLQATSATSARASANSVAPGQNVTLMAQVVDSSPGSVGTPTGTVSFYDGATLVGTAQLASGAASLVTDWMTGGNHTISVVYGGDGNFSGSTGSLPLTMIVAAPDFTIAAAGASSLTVAPGSSGSYAFQVSPLYGTYPGAVTFSYTGVPAGATVSFSPATIAASGGMQTVTMTIQMPRASAALHRSDPLERSTAPIASAILLLPLLGIRRFRRRFQQGGLLVLLVVTGAAAMAGVTGCGRDSSFNDIPVNTYNVTLTATSGTVQHSTQFTLNAQ